MTAPDAATASSPPVAGRYLAFHLGTARYAVPIRSVREVIRLCAITSVPLMPAHVRGVINLRGSVLPVIDLRAKFAMASVDYDDRSCIIVFEVGSSVARLQIGAVVDGVDDVLVVSAEQLGPVPDFAGAIEADYLAGVATTSVGLLILLNIDTVLAKESSLVLR